MKGHLECNSHIWDNLFGNYGATNPRKHIHKSCHDTTGSSVEIYRLETEVTTRTVTSTTSYENPPPPVKPNYYSNPKKCNNGDRSFVTESDRARADPPAHLGSWKYNPQAAFDEYSKRVNRKCGGDGIRCKARRVTIEQNKLCRDTEKSIGRDCAPKICKKTIPRAIQKEAEAGSTLEIRNLRNDEIKIESAKIREKQTACSYEEPREEQYEPAFYGTVEAEKCADRVAEHLSMACENLSRLHFITEKNYPQARKQLKTLSEIGNEIRDFNAQLRVNRAKVPKNILLNGTHVAHFVVENNNSMR